MVPPPTATVARRAGAALIDLAIIFGGEIGTLIAGGVLIQATGATAAQLNAGHVGAATALVRALTQSVLYLGPIAYLYRGWRTGATVGMRSRDCVLRSADGIGKVSSTQVVLRLCGLWYSLVCLGIGLLWGLARSDRRGWPDLLAGTRVVHLPRWVPYPTATWGQPGGWPPAEARPPWPSPPGRNAPPPPPPPPALSAWRAPPPPPPPAPSALAAPTRSEAGPRVTAADVPASDARAVRAPWTWTDVLPVLVLLLPVSFGVEYLTVAAVKWVLRGEPLATRRPIEALASGVAAYAAIFGLVVLMVKVRRHASLAALGLRRVGWRWILAALPFAFLTLLLESITGLLSQSLFPQTPANQCTDIRDAYQGALWLAIIGVAVVAPFVEELVFRGMVFGWLRERVPIAAAVTVSSALFSLEHISFLEVTLFLPIFSTGVVLAILYHHARSIWPTVLVHGAFNLVATLVLFNSVSC